jgi:hypothetical protein
MRWIDNYGIRSILSSSSSVWSELCISDCIRCVSRHSQWVGRTVKGLQSSHFRISYVHVECARLLGRDWVCDPLKDYSEGLLRIDSKDTRCQSK